jgi:hypothetical protein
LSTKNTERWYADYQPKGDSPNKLLQVVISHLSKVSASSRYVYGIVREVLASAREATIPEAVSVIDNGSVL